MAYKSTLSSENIQEALDIIHSAVVIGGGILTLDNQSSSEQISSAIGGEDGFNRILERIRGGNIALGIKVDDTTDNGIIMASIVAPKAENKFTISYLYKGIHYSDEFSLSGSTFSLSQTTEGGGLDSIFQDIQTDSALLESGAVYPIYLTNEKYSEIADAVKNDKIIRLIFACGVFYSVSVLLQPSTASTFVSKIIFGRAFMTGDDLNNFIEAKGKSYTVTFSENNDEGHDEPIKAIVTTEPDINKEIIEEVFTGNITTHTHDTTYTAQELETDVWDGTTVSTSWSGSGTEEDPFLIQSCADYIYFLEGEIPSLALSDNIASSTTKFVKITKNLDFGNKSIPTVTINEGASNVNNYTRANVVVDGNGCIVKNISLDFQSNPIVGGSDGNITYPLYYIPCGMAIFVHDVNFVGVNLKFGYDPSEHLQTVLYYNLLANIVLEMNVEITGSYDKAVQFVITNDYISWPEVGFSSIGSVSKYNNYISEKGCFFGIDIKIQNIPTAGIATILSNSGPFIGYDMSNYTFSGDMENTKGEYVLSLIGNTTPSSFKLSTLSTGKYVHQIPYGSASVIDAETISPEDLKSQSYINKINAENPILALNPSYNLPLIGSMQIKNDGYIRQSLFNEYQKKVVLLENYKNSQLITMFVEIPSSTNSNTIGEFWTKLISDVEAMGSDWGQILFYGLINNGVVPYIVQKTTNSITFLRFHTSKYWITLIEKSGDVYTKSERSGTLIGRENVLARDNTTAFTPIADYHPATKKYVDDNAGGVSKDEVLTKTNTTEYTPTENYHPATKKYVDDELSNLSGTSSFYIDITEQIVKAYSPYRPEAYTVYKISDTPIFERSSQYATFPIPECTGKDSITRARPIVMVLGKTSSYVGGDEKFLFIEVPVRDLYPNFDNDNDIGLFFVIQYKDKVYMIFDDSVTSAIEKIEAEISGNT